jgi:hypothetical protein
MKWPERTWRCDPVRPSAHKMSSEIKAFSKIISVMDTKVSGKIMIVERF